jgi:hypothetical protein
MAGAWLVVGALIALVGTVLGTTFTQKSERSRQATQERSRQIQWSRDRRLDAYKSFLDAVSRRVSALALVREDGDVAARKNACSHAEMALSEMWAAVREVRLVGPEEVARIAERLANHYDHVSDDGWPARGGSIIEEEFGVAARAAIAFSDQTSGPTETDGI